MRTTPARLAAALLYLLTACQQPPIAGGPDAARARSAKDQNAAAAAPAAAPRSSAAPQQTRPELPREFRAAWVATVDNIDWPSRPGLPTAQARAELDAIVARARDLKLNALVFQVRPAADAMYPSKLEPWSEWLTGAQGKAPDEKWDPLAYVIDACHRDGLQLHAWFNPYRAAHPAGKSTPAKNHVLNMMPNVCVTYGKYRWMDPGDQRAADWSLAVIRDVVRRYDVDGVHIDDYFYPYPEKEKGKETLLDFPDQRSFARYQKGGGKLARADWRRANIDAFVQQMYETVHREKPWVQVGISPFGIARPGVPAGIKAGIDQFGQLYADVPKWLEQGWLDYLSPQLYWPIDQTPQSFAVLLPWWHAQNPRQRHMWPGINPGRMIEGKAPIRPDELTAQIGLLRAQKASQGHVHFSFKALRRDAPNVAGALRSSLYATPAIAPESPWLGTDAVPAPVVQWEGGDSSTALTWQAEASAQFMAVQVLTKQGWTTHRVVGAAVGRCALPADATAVAVTAVGRTGVVSAATMSARN